jgi:hypothetical protein
MESSPGGLSAPANPSFARRNKFAVAAVVAGLIALALALIPPLVIEPSPPSALDRLGDLLSDADSPDPAPQLRTFQIATVSLALASVVLAVIAGVRRENRRLIIASIALAATGALWQYIVIAVVAGILLLIVGLLVGG